MAPRGLVTLTTVLLCFLLARFTPAAQGFSMSRKSCCTRYVREPIPFQIVTGYKEQSAMDKCRLEAIIFFTIKKNKICANPEEKWVKRLLELLSSKLKKMSKAHSATSVTATKNHVNHAVDGEGASFYSSTEPVPNSTGGFY